MSSFIVCYFFLIVAFIVGSVNYVLALTRIVAINMLHMIACCIYYCGDKIYVCDFIGRIYHMYCCDKKNLGVAFVVYFMLNNHSDHVYFVAFGLSLLWHKIFNLIFANYYSFVVFFGLIYDDALMIYQILSFAVNVSSFY